MPYKRIEFFEKKQFGEPASKVDVYYIYYGDDVNTCGYYIASLAYKSQACVYNGVHHTSSNTTVEKALSEMLDNIRNAYNLHEYREILSDCILL